MELLTKVMGVVQFHIDDWFEEGMSNEYMADMAATVALENDNIEMDDEAYFDLYNEVLDAINEEYGPGNEEVEIYNAWSHVG